MKEEIAKIIIETLQDLNDELHNKTLENPSFETKLFGADGALDSLSLVLFVTDLEEKISDEFNKQIILADEKAMSQRTSPFRNVESLVNYIENLLKEVK